MTITFLLYIFKLICLIFTTGLYKSLILFIWTYRLTVSYRDALDRLRVHLNIILLLIIIAVSTINYCYYFVEIMKPFILQSVICLVH